MIHPKDITNTSHLSASQKKALEEEMQKDELSYLASVAFEKFNVTPQEIDDISRQIDEKTKTGRSSLYSIFISVLSGLLIGVSIFFIIFQKSKTHPSVYQVMEEPTLIKTLNNKVTESDTIFNTTQPAPQPFTEHYDSKSASVEEIRHVETYDMLSAKTITLDTREISSMEEQELLFIPNAPVVFIHNLKITNYRQYYFKQNQFINLSVHTGLEAQYENAVLDPENRALSKSDAYMAHKIIQRAMQLFENKNYPACKEELNLLIAFNPDDANAQFYLGMCFFLTNNFTKAQPYFQKNQMNENNIFHQESAFYQAMCLLNTNQTDAGLRQLQTIINNKGFYSARAKEIISQNN